MMANQRLTVSRRAQCATDNGDASVARGLFTVSSRFDAKQVVYKEGVFVGYRGYEHNGTKPLFPFGYGLSYTNFAYRNLKIGARTLTSGKNSPESFVVQFDLTNTGQHDGAEVAQVYVGDSRAKLPRPVKELKGFVKINLPPGETRHVSVALHGRAFSYYGAAERQWRADPGDFDILVGSSSDEIELRGKLRLTESDALEMNRNNSSRAR